jgi:hypothetical protein
MHPERIGIGLAMVQTTQVVFMHTHWALSGNEQPLERTSFQP